MLFPSEIFLFVFLPVVLFVYYALLRKNIVLKNIFLLAASLFFYAWGEPKHVKLMIITILLNWLFGILVDSFRDNKILSRAIMVFMVAVNLMILGWFKYSAFVVDQTNIIFHTNFEVPDVKLPIGI